MQNVVNRKTGLRAGAAEAIITPKAPGPMDGIPRPGPAQGVHDDLYAKALVLESGGRKVAMVFLDLIALSATDVDRCRRSVSDRTGIPVADILISCTHNHSGPATLGLFAGRDTDYLADLPDRITEAFALAHERLAEVTLAAAAIPVPGLAFNRRLVLKDGSIRNNWERIPPEEILRTEDDADEEAIVLRIDSLDGALIALIVNFGLHVCVLAGDNFLISADFPAVMARTVKERCRTRQPVVIFAQGCSGDVNHIDGLGGASPVQGFPGVERIGRALGASVIEALGSIPMQREAVIASASRPLRLPWRQSHTSEDVKRARQLLSRSRGPAEMEHGIDPRIEAEELLWLAEQPDKESTIQLQAIRLGPVGLVALPLELFSRFGREIKTGSPFPATMVLTCSNGSEGYVPTEEALASAQGYESKYLRWNKFAPATGSTLVAESLGLLEAIS